MSAFVSKGLRERILIILRGIFGEDFSISEEVIYDSKELSNFDGSYSKSQQLPTFNMDTDFSKPLCLKGGLKFLNAYKVYSLTTFHGKQI